MAKNTQQQLSNIWKAIVQLQKNPVLVEHQHNGFDSTKVIWSDLYQKKVWIIHTVLTPHQIMFATTGSYGGGGTSNAFTVTGVAVADIVSAVIRASTNLVSIQKAVPTVNTITVTFSADPGASTTVDFLVSRPSGFGVFFIVPFTCVLTAFKEVHQTLGTDAGAVTLDLEKLTGTQALDAGVSMLASTLSLKATINSVQTAKLTATNTNRNLAIGDRLAMKDTGVLTAVAGVSVVVELQLT